MLWSSVLLLCISAFGEHKWRKRSTKSGDCVLYERVFVVDFSCASRVFLRVLGFSSLNIFLLFLPRKCGHTCSNDKKLIIAVTLQNNLHRYFIDQFINIQYLANI